MSVSEIIQQIKALPPEELAKVKEFVKRTAPKEPGGMDNETFQKAADTVVEKHGEQLEKLNKDDEPREVRYIDRDEARKLAEQIFSEHDELFRKLADS